MEILDPEFTRLQQAGLPHNGTNDENYCGGWYCDLATHVCLKGIGKNLESLCIQRAYDFGPLYTLIAINTVLLICIFIYICRRAIMHVVLSIHQSQGDQEDAMFLIDRKPKFSEAAFSKV